MLFGCPRRLPSAIVVTTLMAGARGALASATMPRRCALRPGSDLRGRRAPLDADPVAVGEHCDKRCGLSPNWRKVDVPKVRSDAHLQKGAGDPVQEKEA
eukprot:2727779-Pyramimonas_sp.AAC.1